jgi:xylulose-5-phosphate/fructose-6-phosphate phosphoketolase
MLAIWGPGHGAPGVLACLWLEGSLAKFYPQYSRDRDGLTHLISKFSTPRGFPSHINAETPGSIHEGGELGYALAVAFGAVMDKPDIVVPVIVGDGEAESGPTAAAWHSYKYIDPKESGAVLPILHVNGFKISERTIYGCMDDREIVALFSGYGFQVRIVEDLEKINADLAGSLEWALHEIKSIQHVARSDKPIVKPRWPMIVLRTPKGWSGPKKLGDQIIEGSFHSHQVPLPKAKTDPEQLNALQAWLSSYNITDLFDGNGMPTKEVLEIIPRNEIRKLGQVKESYDPYTEIKVPDWKGIAIAMGTSSSMTRVAGKLLDQTFQDNPHSVRLFSPDELESNNLDTVFDHTTRNFQWDQYSNAKGGRVIEILSEHCCQGFMQGYTLTGRVGVFPSYESFLGIIHTMMVQYAKFIKIAKDVPWRGAVGSVNYIESSTWTRQEHNGFSHQNPSFIGAVLNLKPRHGRVYLPPDANCFLSTLAHCLKSKDYVNLMIGSKHPTPVYLSAEAADAHCRKGAGIWEFASTGAGHDPDVVLVGVGVETTFEVIKAAELLQDLAPELRVRVANVTDLMILSTEGVHPHAFTDHDFDEMFTKDRHIHFNYHGYTTELKGLLFDRPQTERITVEGYREEGSTTTPFHMMLLNHVSRYHVAIHALKGGAKVNEKVLSKLNGFFDEIQLRIQKITDYIMQNGTGIFIKFIILMRNS